MSQELVPRWIIRLVVAGALVLPITICVILAVSSLLVAMEDDPSVGRVLKYIAWGVGILWAVDLICLVLVQALNSLTDTDQGE